MVRQGEKQMGRSNRLRADHQKTGQTRAKHNARSGHTNISPEQKTGDRVYAGKVSHSRKCRDHYFLTYDELALMD